MPGFSRKRRLLQITIIFLIAIAFSVLIEVGARLTLPHLASLDLFVETSQQQRQVGAQQSGIFEGDPLLLWRLKPNLVNAVWDFTVLSTNNQHLREEGEIKAKVPGGVRIVCLGDSVTFGYRVPPVWPERPTDFDPDWLPYPKLLEKNLRAANPGRTIEVITMAVPGYTSHQGLAWLRRDIDKFRPDLLIVSYGWNDVSLSDAPDREAIKTNSFAVALRWLIDHSQAFAHATRWLRSKRQSSIAGGEKKWPTPRVSEAEYLSNMNQIIAVAREKGSGVIVIAAPYRDKITNPSEAELMARYRKVLHAEMKRQGISFLEVIELTEAAYPSNQGWFDELIHPNHMGHRLLAGELLELLAAKRITPGLTVPTLTP